MFKMPKQAKMLVVFKLKQLGDGSYSFDKE